MSLDSASPTRSHPDYTAEATYRATRRPVEEATTLIPDAYRSSDFYDLEQQRVWTSGWVGVGYVDQARQPGQMFTAIVAGQSIVIVRGKDQKLRAFYNVCRHRGARLVGDGECKRTDVIRCPYHSWGYALDGRLIGAPYFKGLDVSAEAQAIFDTSEARGFCKDDFPLLPVTVDEWGAVIYVNLDGTAGPLSRWLGDLPQRLANHPLSELKLVRRRPYQIKCNWKLISENFMEYYHLPWVHPELCNISGFDDHYRFQGPGMYTGMITSPLSRDPNTVTFDLPNMPRLNEFELQTAFWILQFPNVGWFLLPNHFFLILFRPDGPGLSIETADLLVHPNALEAPNAQQEIDRVLNFWLMVNDQDIVAVENVQAGLNSRAYPGGRMCFRFEEPIHRFQNMLIDRMVGRDRIPEGDDPQKFPIPTMAS